MAAKKKKKKASRSRRGLKVPFDWSQTDDDEKTTFEIDLPGVDVADVSVTFGKDALVVEAQRAGGTSRDAFKISTREHDVAASTAILSNGVLTVDVPKLPAQGDVSIVVTEE